jgi:prenyltransferase beta subunit
VSLAAGLLGAALALSGAADDGAQSAASGDGLLTARVQALVRPAHDWLVAHQNADGSFSIVRNDAAAPAPVAVTALAALSLMASGNLPDRGRHERAVRRAVDWLVDHCDARGYFTTDSDAVSQMHGQGYAVLALSQAWGMDAGDATRRAELRAALERGVRLIEECQGETGGWWYDPRPAADHEGSMTVCMIQALRAARDVGLDVHAQVVDRAQSYIRRSQNPDDGRFRYRLNDPRTSWALTAASLSTLNALGEYTGEPSLLGFEALQRSDPFTGTSSWNEPFLDYGALYAAQAYWQAPDQRPFRRWWPEFVGQCEQRQREDGHFGEGTYGAVFGTAIVSLTLQVPLGYLPIFQR